MTEDERSQALAKPLFSKPTKELLRAAYHATIKYHEYPTAVRYFITFVRALIGISYPVVNVVLSLVSGTLQGVSQFITMLVDSFINVFTNAEYLELVKSYKQNPKSQLEGEIKYIEDRGYQNRKYYESKYFMAIAESKQQAAKHLEKMCKFLDVSKDETIDDRAFLEPSYQKNINKFIPLTLLTKLKLASQAFRASIFSIPKSIISKILAPIIKPIQLAAWLLSLILLPVISLVAFVLRTSAKAIYHLSFLITVIPPAIFAIPLYIKDCVKAIDRKIKNSREQKQTQGLDIKDDSTTKMIELGIIPQKLSEAENTRPALPTQQLWTKAEPKKAELLEGLDLNAFNAAVL